MPSQPQLLPQPLPASPSWTHENRFAPLPFEDPATLEKPVLPPDLSTKIEKQPISLKLHALDERTDVSDLLISEGLLKGSPISILFDGGASHSFINSSFSKAVTSKPIPIRLPNKQLITGYHADALSFEITSTLLDGHRTVFSDNHSFVAIADLAYDMILGKDWLSKHNPHIDWLHNTILIQNHLISCRLPRPTPFLSAMQFNNILRNLAPDDRVGALMLTSTPDQPSSDKIFTTTSSLDEADKALLETLPDEVRKLIHQYPTVFETFEGLPPSRDVDMKIDLIDEKASPPWRPIYPMSEEELAALKPELEFLLKHGRIRDSLSPYGTPIFYVKQKDKLRLVFDFRALNKNTVKNRAPLPNITEILDRLSRARFFSKFDLASGYHQIRIAEPDIPKTAFRTKYGHFEWVVMPFGLANAPATFQTMINKTFRDFIDDFVTAYIDDILVYSPTYEEHLQHLSKTLQRLSSAGLKVRLRKCQFLSTELDYLGYRIAHNSIQVLPQRTQALRDFETPTSYTELRSFLGLANCLHRFVPHLAELVAPLSSVLKGHKIVPFSWSPQLQQTFDHVKLQLSNPTTLGIFNPDRPVHLYTDWSARAIGSYIAQPDDTGLEVPIAFASRKCNTHESRYHPYMGEILALVEALRVHRPYLLNTDVKVFTDHQSLRHLLDQAKLRPVHHRWLADILSLDFQIQWHPGEWNTIADALSRRSFTSDQSTQASLNVLQPITMEINNDLLQDIKDNLPTDPQFIEISQHLIDPDDPDTFDNNPDAAPRALRTSLSRYRLKGGMLYYIDKTHARIFVPNPLRNLIISLAHDAGPSIHNNWERTFERITRYYHWPNMHKQILNYVQKCDACQRNKVARHLPYGLLEPHDVPPHRWHTVTMDFIGPLLTSEDGYDMILVIIDSASKRTRILPCKQTDNAKDIANLYIKEIWKHHGIPKKIISDRDKLFMATFWQELCKSLNIEHQLATTAHPQTDGQTEQKNDWILSILRTVIGYFQDNWSSKLHIVEFGINDTKNSSTGYTPFYLDTGQHPRSIIDISLNPADSLELRDIRALYQVVKNRIREAQDKQAQHANKKRLESPFKVGDLVLISTKDFVPPNIRQRPSEKLNHRYSGPYKVIELIGPAKSCKLELPNDWHVHNVFHPEKLRPYLWDSSSQHPLSHAPLAVRTVEYVLDKRTLNDQEFVLVKWLNHNPVFNCWIPATAELLEKLRNQYEEPPLLPTSSRTLLEAGVA
jgi:hypothetical protein